MAHGEDFMFDNIGMIGIVILILITGGAIATQLYEKRSIKAALIAVVSTILLSILSTIIYNAIEPIFSGVESDSSSNSGIIAENGDEKANDVNLPEPSPTAENHAASSNENDITGKTSISGAIVNEGQINTYCFTTQTGGTYRFDVDLSAGVDVRVRISGENGSSINYGTNALTIDLEEGKTYLLGIEYMNGACDYNVSIGIPSEITDITGSTLIEGNIVYQDQINKYQYTASVSGTYRMDADVSAGGEVRLRISGENENSINYATNGLTIDLEKGKTYILSVEYLNGPCDYAVAIGVPIPITDVEGNGPLYGSITYQDQRDKYRYTAPVSGTYRLDTDLSSGGEIRIRISGENENSINYGTNGLTIDLEKGETYIISAEYINGTCDYIISIGVPIEITDISGNTSVSGSIAYQDQKDRYLYTAPISGTYYFSTNLSAGGEVRVRISGENERSLNYGTNGLTADLEAGKTYILSVEYTNTSCTYTLSIGY